METSQVKQDAAVQPAAPEQQKGAKSLKVPMPRKKKKWIKRGIILVVLAAIVAFLFRSCMSSGTALLSGAYLPSTATMQDMVVAVSGNGAIEPIRSYRVTTLVRGEVLEAPFEGGGTVREGDLLCRIDSTDTGSPRRCSFSTMLAGFFSRTLMISMGLRELRIDSSSFSTSSLVLTSRIAQLYCIMLSRNCFAVFRSCSGTSNGCGELTA